MSITLTHTRPAPIPHQTPELEPAGLADLSRAPVTTEALDLLDVLEAEAILVIREIAAECRRPVLLFSGGKDSVVMLHLARKAFWPAPIPFPVLHVDTGHNFPEVLAYRDRAASTASSAADAATRRRPGPRSASSPCATSSASGTRATSAPSCGTCSIPVTVPGSTCGSSP